MSHMPVNHPLRQLYRVLAALIGIALLAFGLVSLVVANGEDFFARSEEAVLGLPTNPALAVASLGVGAAVGFAVAVGRNVYYMVNLWGGVAVLVVGLAALALLHTDLNLLNFSVTTVVASFIIGLVLFTAGLYGRSGSPTQARVEEALRHGGH